MATAHEYKVKAQKLSHEAKAVLDEAANATDQARSAELEARFDTMIAEADRLRSLGDKLAREEAIEAEINAADPRRPTENRSAEVIGAVSDEQRAADSYNMFLRSGEINETRDGQVVGTPSAGGYLVPTTLASNIITVMKRYGGLWDSELVTVLNTSTGEPITFPTFDDTAGTATHVAEATAQGNSSINVGALSLGSYDLGSGVFKVSYQLLRDSNFDVPGLIAGAMGERFGRTGNDILTNGTGSNQGQGLITALTAANTAITTANSLTVADTDLIDLIHSVDPAYRDNGTFMLSDAYVQKLRKVKDSTGQFIWQPGMQAGTAGSLLGYRFVVNNNMTSAATAGVLPIVFGDFKRFYVRRVGGISLTRMNELYAVTGQVGFAGHLSYDCKLTDTNAIKALKLKA